MTVPYNSVEYGERNGSPLAQGGSSVNSAAQMITISLPQCPHGCFHQTTTIVSY